MARRRRGRGARRGSRRGARLEAALLAGAVDVEQQVAHPTGPGKSKLDWIRVSVQRDRSVLADGDHDAGAMRPSTGTASSTAGELAADVDRVVHAPGWRRRPRSFPRSFFDDFPLGRGWVVGAGGPYNEHLVRDVGVLFVALMVATAWTAWTRAGDRALAAAWIIQGVAHLGFHAAHLHHLSGRSIGPASSPRSSSWSCSPSRQPSFRAAARRSDHEDDRARHREGRVRGRASGRPRGRRRGWSTATSRGGCGPGRATPRSAAPRRDGRRCGSAPGRSARSRPHLAERRLHTGADVDDEPAPPLTRPHEGVDDVVDVHEVAALAAVPRQPGRLALRRGGHHRRRSRHRRGAGAARTPTTGASAVNSIPKSSR